MVPRSCSRPRRQRHPRSHLIPILMLLGAAAPLSSQAAALEQGSQVRIWQEGRHEVYRFLTCTADTLSVNRAGETLAIPRGAVDRLDVRTPLSRGQQMARDAFTGALVGALAGALVGLTVLDFAPEGASAFSTPNIPGGVVVLAGAVYGIPVGFVVGGMVGAVREPQEIWKTVHPSRWSVAAAPLHHGVSLGVAISL